jgi:peptide deformylase
MSVLDVKKYPDPILRKRASEIGEITPEIRKLAEDMAETMLKEDGVGLAGPQVGISKKIIAVQTESGPSVFINPKITKKYGEKVSTEEGCLSLPGIWLKIKRSEGVEIEAIDLDGKKLNIKAEGFQARVFQHEIDHLNGVLIIDRVGFFNRLKAKKQLKRNVL